MQANPQAPARELAAPADNRTGRAQSSRSAAVLSLQAQALAHERFGAAAAAALNHLALELGCERVSIGLHAQGRLRVGAISGADDPQPQQNIVRLIAAAMAESIGQRTAIVHPLPPGASPTVSLAHAALARANGQAAVCSVPIATQDKVLGALLFERRAGFDAATVEAAKDAALFVGPILDLKHRIDAPIAGRLFEALAPRGQRMVGVSVAPWQLGALLLSGALATAALWPVTQRVVAPARIEGAVQRVIAAPADGFVAAVSARPGETVAAGQVLIRLDDQELVLERDKRGAEIAQLDKQYGEALSKDEPALIVVARSKLEQARTEHALASRQLERSTLRAPIDGVLISGDLSQSLGLPVKRGQELMTIAPDKSFRVVAEVDEQDIGALNDGQRARVLFAAQAERPVEFTVTRIAPVATPLEGRNVFEVEGHLAAGEAVLRPGLRGVARIDVGERSWGAVCWQRASNALRRLAWRVLG